jgi:hypothetical protein
MRRHSLKNHAGGVQHGASGGTLAGQNHHAAAPLPFSLSCRA